MTSKSKTQLQLNDLQDQVNKLSSRIDSLADLIAAKFIEIEKILTAIEETLTLNMPEISTKN